MKAAIRRVSLAALLASETVCGWNAAQGEAAAHTAPPQHESIRHPELPNPTVLKERLRRKFEQLGAQGFRGVAIVEIGHKVIFAGAAGEANPVQHVPYRIDTPVEIGSLTKAFTAAAILKLADLGRLSLQDKVSRFFPAAQGPLAGASVHQLLTHSSGLPMFASTQSTAPDPEPIDRATFLRRAFATPLEFLPGRGFAYSNAGYSVLAAIIEQVSGQSYHDFVQHEVIAPAGVHGIGYGQDVDILTAAKSSTGRGIDDTSWGAGGPYWNLLGNGGFISDPIAFVRWRRAFADGRIVSGAEVRAAGIPWVKETSGNGGEGYGWVVGQTKDLGTVELAAGGNQDFTSEMRYYRDIDLITFVATNGDVPAGVIASHFIAAAFNQPEPVLSAGSPAEQELIDSLVKLLNADAGSANTFLDAHIGPVFREKVGLEAIESRFALIRAALSGATLEQVQPGRAGTASLKFKTRSGHKLLTIEFGGTPDKPRIAGFSLSDLPQ